MWFFMFLYLHITRHTPLIYAFAAYAALFALSIAVFVYAETKLGRKVQLWYLTRKLKRYQRLKAKETDRVFGVSEGTAPLQGRATFTSDKKTA